MQNKPQISVIMCVYNTKKEYFYNAVKSILEQTFKDFELLIIDDGSCDTYDDFPFADKRIKILKNIENLGVAESRNIGLKNAIGKYVAMMDSDDFSYPTRLEKQFKFMEENLDVVACGTWFRFFGDKNHEVKRIFDNNEYYKCCLLFGNSPTILNPSVMIRKSVIDENQLSYHPSLRIGEDYFMWIQLVNFGKIVNYPEVLFEYRYFDKQLTKSIEYTKNKTNPFFLKYQLEKIDCSLNEDQINLFLSRLSCKKINLEKLIGLLDFIKGKNKFKQYFDDVELNKRCNEEIRKVILFNKNIFWIIKYLFNRKTSKLIFKTEFSRVAKR